MNFVLVHGGWCGGWWMSRLARALRRRLSANDLLASLTELTAQSIALNYRLHLPAPPDAVVLCGGGARNPVLRERLFQALAEHAIGSAVLTSDEAGWPASRASRAPLAVNRPSPNASGHWMAFSVSAR